MLTVTIFGSVATITNRPWWAVQNKAELGWTPAAAELANEYLPSMEAAEHAAKGLAVVQVMVGVGAMIGKRVAEDKQAGLEYGRSRRAQMMREEGVPISNMPDPDAPAPAPPQRPPRTGNGSGAASTHPGPISGLGGADRGLV